MTAEEARDQAWEAIRTVTDPELDESVADLGFIQSLTITPQPPGSSATNHSDVHITFRLPTYWCAANFAFMMAEDIRDRVSQLPWVREARVELADHFTAGEINNGIAAGHSFITSFPTEASENLVSLRRLFRLKAFQRRQYRLLKYLIGASHASRAILAMTIADLRDRSLTDAEGSRLRSDYLAILPEFARPPGPDASRRSVEEPISASVSSVEAASASSSADASAPAFILPNGKPLDPESLDAHLRELRRTTINIEFNSALCSSLLKARNNRTLATKPHPQAIE